MIRADNVICGTSTTGTGTLTLAATPGPPGGVDFDVFCRAVGIGNSAVVIVSYTIVEYTDATFVTAKATEKGVGTLTLGGSAGIANCTLARSKLQTSATSLNSQPATQNIVPALGISIGTAANTLVFIGASNSDSIGFSPFYEGVATPDPIGPMAIWGNQSLVASTAGQVSGTDYYVPFIWMIPMKVKSLFLQVQNVYTGGTSNCYGRIYQVNASGRPGKLLLDFGVLGTPNASFGSVANITGTASGSYFMMPGVYFLNVLGIFTGGTGTPNVYGTSNMVCPMTVGIDFNHISNNGFTPWVGATATSGNATAADPANLTGYSVSAGGGAAPPTFALKSS